jgi:Kef-type K+ transport system membrane component KefB/voltage-gated potassium channel Kch
LTTALALGLPLALSSTAQVLPMLQSAGRLRTPFGERAFAILLFQDLSIIPLITIVAALSVRETGVDGPEGWRLIVLTLLAIAGLVLAGRYLLPRLFRFIGSLGEREMFIVAGLFAIVGAAAVMEWLGMSTALGAFIAGVMLANTPYRHELEADIEPFRSILLGLFFLSVGMTVDLSAVAREPLFVVGMAAALVLVKTGLIFSLGMVMKMGWRPALALGLLLSQGGEFGFVLFAQARAGGIIDAETASLFGAIVTLSMATTPFLMMATRRIRQGGADDRTREEPVAEGASALVIGYGRFGQTVAQMLTLGGIRVSLIDRKVDQIDVAQEFGTRVFYGDGLRLDMLRQAGAAEAALICFCMDGDQVEPEFLHSVQAAFPQATIMLRAFDRRTAMKVAGAKVGFLVREVRESALAMGRAALDSLGSSPGEIERLEDHFRTNDRLRLAAQAETGDLHAGEDRIIRVALARNDGEG